MDDLTGLSGIDFPPVALRCPDCGTSFPARETACLSCGFRLKFDGRAWDARPDRMGSAEFSRQWELWEEGQLGRRDRIYGVSLGDCFATMMDTVGLSVEDLRGKRVLEVGYGLGAVLERVQDHCPMAVGMDLTRPPRGTRLRPGSCFCADLLCPPFLPGQFDLVICQGVLQHMSDPVLAFEKVAEQVAPRGILHLDIYEKGDKGSLALRKIFRSFSRYPENIQLGLATGIGNLRAFLEVIRRCSIRKDGFRTLCGDYKLAVYDVLTPVFTSQHDPEEILSWFSAQGFSAERRAPRRYVGVRI
jgi:SAM-dependent methyltransferase